jgi:hypothetical protein
LVIPDPAIAKAAKRKIGIADLKDGVVDDTSSKTYLAEHLFLLLFIAGKIIQGQWFGAFHLFSIMT